MIERVQAVELAVKAVKSDVNKIEHHLYGNGKDGALLRLDRLEQSRLAMKDRIAIWIGPVVSGLLVAFVSFVLSRIK